jgi:hypothetical protein
MINFSLKCARGHEFEAWFRNGDTFDAQSRAGEVACPACGVTSVEKARRAPRLVKSRGDSAERSAQAVAELRRGLADLRRQVEEKCDYVGAAFPEEARKIHYGETPARAIYGEATAEQAGELREEGIEVATVPWVETGDA